LINRFDYLDLIVQDLPIYDDKYFKLLFDAFPKANETGKRFLPDRVNLIKIFLQYLKIEESKQSIEMKSRYGNIVADISKWS
jgi:hypothetical protein